MRCSDLSIYYGVKMTEKSEARKEWERDKKICAIIAKKNRSKIKKQTEHYVKYLEAHYREVLQRDGFIPPTI